MLTENVKILLFSALPAAMIFGALLLYFVNLPNILPLKGYRKARKAMAVAYLIFGLLCLFPLFEQKESEDMMVASLVWMIVPSSQAFLFVYAFINLIDLQFFTRKRVWLEIAPILFFSILALLALVIHVDIYPRVMFLLFLLFYTFQLCYYTWLFMDCFKKYQEKADDYFSGNEADRLHWVRTAFFSVLVYGVIALGSMLIPDYKIKIAVSFLGGLFYVVILFKYMNYPYTFYALQAFLMQEGSTHEEVSIKKEFEKKLNAWVENKTYCTPGLTVALLTDQLKCQRNEISTYIKESGSQNFNSWINTFRIEEAKRMLKNEEEISIAQVAERLGFTEISCFSRYFKKITGKSPLNWRKENRQMFIPS